MDYFDLTLPLITDTILIVKIGSKWVHYNTPINKKDGTRRTYGDLYHYFSNQDGFRFAKGYVRQGDPSLGECYSYQFQYLYFSREEPPMMDNRELPERRFYTY